MLGIFLLNHHIYTKIHFLVSKIYFKCVRYINAYRAIFIIIFVLTLKCLKITPNSDIENQIYFPKLPYTYLIKLFHLV